jgi:hypothetical protein
MAIPIGEVLTSKGVVLYKNKALGNKAGNVAVDINGDGKIQEKTELVPDIPVLQDVAPQTTVSQDTNTTPVVQYPNVKDANVNAQEPNPTPPVMVKDGIISNEELLDFVVNNVNTMPQIRQIDIVKTFQAYQAEVSPEVQKKVDALGVSLSKKGIHPLADQNIYYLPSGDKLIGDEVGLQKIDFYPSKTIMKVTVSKAFMVTLPTGEKTSLPIHPNKMKRICYSEEGAISWMDAENFEFVLPDGQLSHSSWVNFDKKGKPTSLVFISPLIITLPTGDTVSVSELYLNGPNNTPSVVMLAKPSSITTAKGQIEAKTKVRFDAGGQVAKVDW